VIDAIAWKFQTGSQWVHLPEKYGNWRRVYNRLRMWAVDGTWGRVFTALVAQADAEEDLNWAVAVDSTVVRARPHAGQVVTDRILDGHEVQRQGIVDPHRREMAVCASIVQSHDGGEEARFDRAHERPGSGPDQARRDLTAT
jgi:transposase